MPAKSTSHLILISMGTLLSAFSLGCVLAFSDPYTSGFFVHAFLYLSLFMTACGIFVLLGLILRLRFAQGLYINNLAVSFRQAIFASTLGTFSLFLQAKGLLFWWVALTLFLFFLSLEIFINTK